jgi:hypothetical protein
MAFLWCKRINTLLFWAVMEQLKATWHVIVCVKLNVGFARFFKPGLLEQKVKSWWYFRISTCPKIFTKTCHSFQMEVNAPLIQQRSLFVSLLDFWDGNAEENCRIYRIKLELWSRTSSKTGKLWVPDFEFHASAQIIYLLKPIYLWLIYRRCHISFQKEER